MTQTIRLLYNSSLYFLYVSRSPTFCLSHWPLLSYCSMECLRFTLQLLDRVKNIFIKAVSFSLARSRWLILNSCLSSLHFPTYYFVKRSSSLLLYGMTTQQHSQPSSLFFSSERVNRFFFYFLPSIFKVITSVATISNSKTSRLFPLFIG